MPTNKIKVKAGDIVYLAPTKDNMRRNQLEEITKAAVIKVGAKYLTVKLNSWELRFDKITLWQQTDYAADWELFFSEQELRDARVAKELRQQLSRYFSLFCGEPHDLTRDQLERIIAITREGLQEETEDE